MSDQTRLDSVLATLTKMINERSDFNFLSTKSNDYFRLIHKSNEQRWKDHDLLWQMKRTLCDVKATDWSKPANWTSQPVLTLPQFFVALIAFYNKRGAKGSRFFNNKVKLFKKVFPQNIVEEKDLPSLSYTVILILDWYEESPTEKLHGFLDAIFSQDGFDEDDLDREQYSYDNYIFPVIDYLLPQDASFTPGQMFYDEAFLQRFSEKTLYLENEVYCGMAIRKRIIEKYKGQIPFPPNWAALKATYWEDDNEDTVTVDVLRRCLKYELGEGEKKEDVEMDEEVEEMSKSVKHGLQVDDELERESKRSK